jgi:branched-subunit amino acid transport protein
MNDTLTFLLYLLIMALVTYLLRIIPLLFITKSFKSKFMRSIIYYTPYCVLAAMSIPAMLYVTPNLITGIVATVTAIAVALVTRNLIAVASLSAISILIMELLIVPLFSIYGFFAKGLRHLGVTK